MKVSLVLALFAMLAAATALVRKRATSFEDHNRVEISDDPKDDHEAFLEEFYPEYEKDDKHHQRVASFMKCRQDMIDHDPEEAGWATGLTHFCHMTAEEISNQWNHHIGLPDDIPEDKKLNLKKRKIDTRALAAKIDWRTWNGVSSVKNQGQCGSCYTFAAAAALEGAYSRKYGQLYNISTQQYVDCSYGYSVQMKFNQQKNAWEMNGAVTKSGGNGGCQGGWYQACWGYNNVTGQQQNSWECYPYKSDQTMSQGACAPNSNCNLKIGGVSFVSVDNEDELAYALNYYGPVACAFDASSVMSYTGGIADMSRCSKYANHAIVVVGYDQDSAGNKYWIIKNSWGTWWGEKGYFRLPRGYNACGIGSNNCAYPLVA